MAFGFGFGADVLQSPISTVNKEAAEAASGAGGSAEHHPRKRVTWAADLERVRVFDVEPEDPLPKHESMAWEVVQMLAATTNRPTLLRVKQRLEHKFDISLRDSHDTIVGVLSKVQQACNRFQAPASQASFVPASMTAQLMVKLLKAFGLPLAGSQAELVDRLQKALAAAAVHGHAVANDSAVTNKTPAVTHQAEPPAAAPTDRAATPSFKSKAVLPQEPYPSLTNLAEYSTGSRSNCVTVYLQQGAPSLSGDAWASSSAVGHLSKKRKVAKYDSSSAGHGAASKRIKGVLPPSKGKAATEISQSATQAPRSADEAPQHPQDKIEAVEVALQAGGRQAHCCNPGLHEFDSSCTRLAFYVRISNVCHLGESAGSAAAASSSESEPSRQPQGGSGHDGGAASVKQHRLIQLEEAGSNPENALQPYSSTVKRQKEQPKVGVQQQSPLGLWTQPR
ncbi:hypothetical protein ABBQ38_014846 [Trebouxia sp. C0009 RCD-2024]